MLKTRKEKNFKNTSTLHFTLKLPPLVVGVLQIYNFMSPYPTDSKCQIWLRLAQYMLFLRRRYKPKAIGHLSYSGDLKMHMT